MRSKSIGVEQPVMHVRKQGAMRPRVIPVVLLAGILWSCTTSRHDDGHAAPEVNELTSYVVLADGGQAIARVATADAQCPALWIDGVARPMSARAAPASLAARPGQAKPSAFPERICEAPLPAGTRSARVADRVLPLPKAESRRIVVLGDTGCRIKSSEHAFQACDDPEQWPFAAIAAAAARENPDLVIHVGDYHYRESACPQDQPCANSAWGYGWDAWNADFFVPARPLLQAAPWVVVRGNHEECARAGQGWFRLLDARPYDAQRSCDESHNDAEANFSDPYAVPLGSHWQLIVFDSALASKPLNLGKSADLRRLARYRENMLVVDALASAPGMHSIFVSHHPVLGFTVKASRIQFGNQALLDAMKLVNGSRYFPPGVEASLHGHVHSFEAINFSSGHPAALVAGHGGDNLDTELSDSIGTAYPSAEAVRIDSVAHAHSFGYLLLERGTNGWTVSARRRDGSTLTVCTLRGTHLACGAGVASVHPGGHG
jgi:hypothetical protein